MVKDSIIKNEEIKSGTKIAGADFVPHREGKWLFLK